jgi:hypothetical protein
VRVDPAFPSQAQSVCDGPFSIICRGVSTPVPKAEVGPATMTIEPDAQKPIFEDEHIRVTLNSFNKLTRVAAAYVHEKSGDVGSYRILVRFVSGHEAAYHFDGKDKYRTAFFVVLTPHEDDGVADIEVRRGGG